MSASLRDASLSALVALGLFGPMVGLLTAPTDRGLVLIPRPLPVAALVAALCVNIANSLRCTFTPMTGSTNRWRYADRAAGKRSDPRNAGAFARCRRDVNSPFTYSRHVRMWNRPKPVRSPARPDWAKTVSIISNLRANG